MNKVFVKFICLLALSSTILTGCSQNDNTLSSDSVSNTEYSSEQLPDVLVTVNEEDFTVKLEDNDTARDLVSEISTSPMLLPPAEDMDNISKVYSLPRNFSSNDENVNSASQGDIFLNGNDQLVLFYKDTDISANYTKVGHIEDCTGLADAVGPDEASFYVSIK